MRTSRVVILRADHLGDMILTTPLVHALGENGCEVAVVGPRAWRSVWEGNPWARYTALEDICPAWPRDWVRLGAWLRRNRFDHLLVPYHEPRLLLASFLSGIRHRACQMGRYLGRLTLHQPLRTHLQTQPRHMGDVWLDYARHLGVQPTSVAPELFLKSGEKESIRELLDSHLEGGAPLVAIHPFHGGSTCHIPLCDYASLVMQILQRFDCRIIVSGTAGDLKKLTEETALPNSPRLWVSCGQLGLRQLFAVIASARVLVVGSTGPLHVASALGIATVSGFCPHPAVGMELWGNLVPGSQVAKAPLDRCARSRGLPPAKCTALCGTMIPQLLVGLEQHLEPLPN